MGRFGNLSGGRWAAVVVVGVMAWTGVARGAVLAKYDFTGGSGPGFASVDADPNSTAGAFTRTFFAEDFRPDEFVGNPPPSYLLQPSSTTVDAAKQSGAYLLHTLTPAPGYAVNLQSMSIDVSAFLFLNDVASYAGQVAVFTSLDGFVDPIYFTFATDTTADLATTPWFTFNNTALASNPLLQNVTGPVEFRYHAWSNNITKGFFFVDNITLSGTSSAIPEPGSMLVLCATFPVLLRHHRRHTVRYDGQRTPGR